MESVWSRAQEALVAVLGDSNLSDAFCPGHFPFARELEAPAGSRTTAST
jgi:hypothetical protein